ncbi:MAG: hypothetical protein D3916_16365 [Candidatus Electrothrix sp. MAN1_4]|nr:hypothetical protein [Candidatus Electrothrix sp. MAN1_4]
MKKKIAQRWGDYLQLEANGRITVTYCTGCVDSLRSRLRIVHLLDLIFAPKASLAGRVRVAKPPFTYLNRLYLKQRLKRYK